MLFNNAKSVFQHIEKIAATSSKLEKEALVKEGMGIPLFVKVVTYAYDRFKIYGMRDVPVKTPGLAPGANTLDEPLAWSTLDALAAGTLSGDAARNMIQQLVDLLDESSSALFRRIILKDLRAGFTDGTVNRVAPGTLPEFPYMRCGLLSKVDTKGWPWAEGVISQEKADGMFANVNRRGNVVSITSRQGSPFPAGAMPDLEAALVAVFAADTQTHGELLVYQDGELLPREQGNGVLNSLLSGGALESGQEVRFMAWDQIPLTEVKAKGKYSVGYKIRLVHLLGQLKATGGLTEHSPVRVIDTRVVKSMEDAMAHYRELLRQGKEGTILKHPNAIWKDGTSKEQLKLKLEIDVDLKVTAVVPGRADTKNEGRAGSLTCTSACGQLVVDVTIKNEAMRDAVDANPGDWINRVMAVRANSIMMPSESNELHSLFLPRFVEAGYRTDKDQADDLPRVRAQFQAAVSA